MSSSTDSAAVRADQGEPNGLSGASHAGGARLEVAISGASYGAHRVLRAMTVSVPAGTGLAVMGKNGVGKTTLLRSVLGVFGVRVDGEVRIDDQPVAGLAPDAIVRKYRVAFVPADRRMLPVTVLENLKLGALDRETWRERADSMLDLFPFLKPRLRQTATTLSGGEQQALAIARAGMLDPRLLLLDEPAEGLSPIATERMLTGLVELRGTSGCTVVVAERSQAVIRALCTHAIGLDKGSPVFQGAVEDLFGDEALLQRLLLPLGREV